MSNSLKLISFDFSNFYSFIKAILDWYSAAQKNDPCAKKNEPRNKKLSVNKIYIFCR